MRRIVLALFVITLYVSPLAAEKETSVAQTKEILFWGKGFAQINGVQKVLPIDLSIHKLYAADLKKPRSDTEIVFVAKLLIAKSAYSIRIINPRLESFEADVINANGTDEARKVSIPIGHITLKVDGGLGIGKLKIQIEDQKDLSGQFDVLLNDMTDLMRVYEMAIQKKAE